MEGCIEKGRGGVSVKQEYYFRGELKDGKGCPCQKNFRERISKLLNRMHRAEL